MSQDTEDSFKEFNEWFTQSFIARNAGYYPKRMDKWHERVGKFHKKIREFLGNQIRIENSVNLKSCQNPVKPSDAEVFIQQITDILPQYLASYQFSSDVFLKPTIPQGTHNVIKLTKHIVQYANTALKYDNDPKTKLAIIAKALSGLGDLWARSRTSDSNLEVTISTSPKAFALLGHYGPDKDSCFRQGSDHTPHKYILGQTDNTFVICISKFDEKKKKQKAVARAFGFISDDFNTISISNYYFVPGFTEGDGIEAIRAVLENLWKDQSEFHEDRAYIVGSPDTLFQNPYGKWTFTKGKDTKLKEHHKLYPNTHMISTFICPHCGMNERSDANWTEVDGQDVCGKCVQRANKCQISGKITFKELVIVVKKGGESVMAHPEVADTFHRCTTCSIPHEEHFVMDQNTNICSDCFESGYSECEECGKVVADGDFCNIGTLDLCNACVNSGKLPFEDEEVALILTHQESNKLCGVYND